MRLGQLLRLCIVLTVKVPLTVLFTALCNIAKVVAPNYVFGIVRKIMESDNMMRGAAKPEDATFIFSMERVRMQTKMWIRDIIKPAQVGKTAPDVELVNLDTKDKVFLLSLARAGRPMVLNFGNVT